MKEMRPDRLTTILIVLSSAALALVILTVFIVFFPSGSSQITVQGNSSTTSFGTTAGTTTANTATSTATGVGAATTSIATAGNSNGQFSSTYAYPYPITWTQGNEQFAVTGAAITDGKLTLTLAIQIGSTPECVAVNLRLVADENGSLENPVTPGGTFIFPDSQSCNGTPGATYSQSVIFAIPASSTAPYLVTTGGSSNVYFNVAPNTSGGIDVTPPASAG